MPEVLSIDGGGWACECKISRGARFSQIPIEFPPQNPISKGWAIQHQSQRTGYVITTTESHNHREHHFFLLAYPFFPAWMNGKGCTWEQHRVGKHKQKTCSYQPHSAPSIQSHPVLRIEYKESVGTGFCTYKTDFQYFIIFQDDQEPEPQVRVELSKAEETRADLTPTLKMSLNLFIFFQISHLLLEGRREGCNLKVNLDILYTLDSILQYEPSFQIHLSHHSGIILTDESTVKNSRLPLRDSFSRTFTSSFFS